MRGQTCDEACPVFQFARLERTRPNLVYRPISGRWLDLYLAANPRALGHTTLDEGLLLLTDSTTELRAFIARHQGEAGFWSKDASDARYAGPPPAAPAKR